MKALLFRLFSLILACLAMTAGPVKADSWIPPEKRTTVSSNGQFRFTAYPTPEAEVKAFFEREMEGRSVVPPHAIGRLQRKRAKGGWETVWKVPLANIVAPTDALVTNDGRHVVTFDNWYSTGHGENVIVIYRADGSVVRSLKLTDLVPDYYMQILPHSASSIDWRSNAEIGADGQTVEIDVFGPGTTFLRKNASSLRFRIALSDGNVSLPEEPIWKAALAKARRFALELVRARLEDEHMDRSPITAPAGCDAWNWEDYLEEVFERQAPEGSDEGYVAPHVMLPVGEEDHERRLTNFKWEPNNRYRDQQRMALAAPCASDALLLAARAVAQRSLDKRETFSRVTLWVAAAKADFDQVAQVLAPTGITTIWIDPDLPIPQRPDRFPKTDDSLHRLQAHEQRLLAEIAAEQPAPSDQQMP